MDTSGHKPNVISTFSGCGGSSLGYEMAGCDVRLALDNEKMACKIHQDNFSNCKILCKDIRQCNGRELLELVQISELDILDGSPPCQPFSMSGDREKLWNVDGKEDLFFEYVRLIREIKPKCFIAENVKGLIIGKAKGYFKLIYREMEKLGYDVKAGILNSMYYGVSQSRERVIFIGIRNNLDIEPSLPKPQTRPITVRQAWDGLSNTDLELEIAKSHIPHGTIGRDLLGITTQGQILGMRKVKGWFNHFRLDYQKPCPTIASRPDMIFHPIEDRTITITELKRLQSFPDNFIFNCSAHEARKRIGNSVPPMLMYHIAKHVKDRIFS